MLIYELQTRQGINYNTNGVLDHKTIIDWGQEERLSPLFVCPLSKSESKVGRSKVQKAYGYETFTYVQHLEKP